MNRTSIRLFACVILILTAALAAVAQGLYWESTTVISAMGGKERHSKTYYMPKMYKVEADLGNDISIIRLDKELFITVNTDEKTYSEVTFAEMEGMMKQAGSMMNEKLAAIQDKLKSMPEEQRKMVEKMMGNNVEGTKNDGDVVVEKGTEKKTINGFACIQNVIKKGESNLATVWTTQDIPGLKDMGKELKEFRSRIASTIPMNGKSLAVGYKGLDGFPVKTEMSMLTTTVTKIEKHSTPAAEFEVPAGYKKVKSKLLEMQEKMDEKE